MSIFEKREFLNQINLKVSIVTLIMLKQSREDVEGFCVCASFLVTVRMQHVLETSHRTSIQELLSLSLSELHSQVLLNFFLSLTRRDMFILYYFINFCLYVLDIFTLHKRSIEN